MSGSAKPRWMRSEIVCPGVGRTIVEGLQATDTHYACVNNLKWSAGGEVTVTSSMCWLDLVLSPHSYSRSYPDGEVSTAGVRGPLVFAPPGTRLRHSWNQPELRTLTCLFDPQAMMPLSAFDWDWSSAALERIDDARSSRLQRTLERLAEEVISPGFASDLQVSSLILLAACELRELVTMRPAERDDRHTLTPGDLQRIRQMIDDSADRLPTIQALADELRLDPRQLSRRFKATTGQTLRYYAANARIARARLLLNEHKLLVKQIAHCCGFSTTASFTAAFHKVVGMTPSAYRHTAKR